MSAPIAIDPDRPQGHALRLLEFLHGLGSHTPAAPMDKARWCLLDALGCGLLGARQPWGEIMVADVLADGTTGACSLLGHPARVAPAQAALCNGTAIHGFELDDLLSEAVIHPGAVIVPAALAAAESVDASGEQLLRGIVAGYEATARISIALGMEASQRGFHKTSVVGPVAGAIAAAVTMRLSLDQLHNAVGLACSCAGGIKNFATGSAGMVKRMHAGRAAEAAVRMASLARRGFTAPPAAIDGTYGLLDAFSGSKAQLRQLDAQLGAQWAIDDVWVKVYPICGWIQGVVQLLLDMRAGAGVQAHDVEKVVVATSAFAVRNNANVDVRDTMDAQYSIPYCVSVALTGDPGDPNEFGRGRIFDFDAGRKLIAERVELRVDPVAEQVYPRQFACRVELHLKDGRTLSAETRDPHGTPADPCSLDERVRKFTQLARLAGASKDLGHALAMVRSLESGSASVRQLMREICPG
ncbi:MmgE/PrpD family protein [Variovorax defluvii]|uniref:MmgE/PrpD family protein n=1 Tax=Variovorax defluvii TaxID=913761 RepID=A0ABP8HL42_9BURK